MTRTKSVGATLTKTLAASLAAVAAADVVPVQCGACGHEWPGRADGGDLCAKCGSDRVAEVVPTPACQTCEGPTEAVQVAGYPAFRCYVCDDLTWGTP